MENETALGQRKIIFVIDSFSGGGAERVVLTLAEAFHQRQYEIDALTLIPAEVSYTIPNYIHVFSTDNLPLSSGGWKVAFVRKAFSLWKRLCKKVRRTLGKTTINILRDSKFELYATHSVPIKCYLDLNKDATVISFLNLSVTAVALIAKRVHNRIILSERSDPRQYANTDPKMCKLRDRYFRYADFGVFQTPLAAEYYAMPKRKKVIIPNPIRADLPPQWEGIRKKEFVSLGRYHELKNLGLLIRAFSGVHKVYSGYTLRLYGHGPMKEYLAEQIQKSGLQDCVFLEPFCEDALQKVSSATAYVNSSDREGICNAMLECMGAGMPVICTDCPVGGAAMFIQSYENGILVPIGDEDKLQNAMLYIIEHPEESARMGTRAMEVREICDRERIVEKWMNLI